MSWSRGRTVGILAVLIMVGAGCTSTVGGEGRFGLSLLDAPNAEIEIQGLPASGPTGVDIIAGNAIADIQDFWSQEMPRVHNQRFEPPEALYSVDPDDAGEVPCINSGEEIRGNAFFCSLGDVVAWDRKELFPALARDFGAFLIAMVLAHEYGHAVQNQVGDPGRNTITLESQADCFAGAWTAFAARGDAEHFQPDETALDQALAGYLNFSDPVGVVSPNDPSAHGNGFDRIAAFQEGFERGTDWCAGSAYTDERVFTEIEFRPEETDNLGNLPFDAVITDGPNDINAFWETTMPLHYGEDLDEVRKEAVERIECDGDNISQVIHFCADNRTIYLDQGNDLQRVHNRTGDFAVITLLGMNYAQAVRDQLGRPISGDDALLDEICMHGAYAKLAFEKSINGQEQGLLLSAGDLDEAIQTLLTYVADDDFFDVTQTTGFQRVDAFRNGFNDLENCD